MLSVKVLGIIAGITLFLALFAPIYYLVLFDLTLIKYVSHWSFGGVRVDASDLIVASIVGAMLLRGSSWQTTRIPYLVPWIILGIFMSLAYATAPQNARSMTDPVRIVYQLARYCWKPLLYYPLFVILLRSPKQAHHAFLAILVGADLCAIDAIKQGYAGANAAGGPFGTGNELAAALVIPFVVAFSGACFPRSLTHWIFSGLSLAILARAVLFSASRGGLGAALAGSALLSGIAFLLPTGRRYVLRAGLLGAVALALLLAVRPDVFERKAVKHAASVVEGQRADTMRWRMTERWPHFIALALEKPFLGTGTAVDPSLGERANTPHNGYINLAVSKGFVVLFLYLFFFYRLTCDSLKVFRRSGDFHERIFAITLLAGLLAVMLHNFVDGALVRPALGKFLWLFCALGASRANLPQSLGAEAEGNLAPHVAEEHAAGAAPLS